MLIAFSPAQFINHELKPARLQWFYFPLLVFYLYSYSLEKKGMYFFLLACLSVGVATSIHIQAVALIPFFILTIILFRKYIVRKILYLGIGLSVPWIPVLIPILKYFLQYDLILTYLQTTSKHFFMF